MALDTGYLEYDGVQYAVTASVDEETEAVYQVMVWHHPPIPGVSELFGQFNATEARSTLEVAALVAIENLYGFNPVLERNR
jgi:hypothetical protein